MDRLTRARKAAVKAVLYNSIMDYEGVIGECRDLVKQVKEFLDEDDISKEENPRAYHLLEHAKGLYNNLPYRSGTTFERKLNKIGLRRDTKFEHDMAREEMDGERRVGRSSDILSSPRVATSSLIYDDVDEVDNAEDD